MYNVDPEIERKEILKRYSKLLRAWTSTKTKENRLLVRKAFYFAAEAHKDMRRRTGEPYIYHPLEVARIAAGDIGLGATSIVCALLHDVVEDTDYSLADIKNMFGEKVAKIIDGLTKIKEIFDQSKASYQAENYKKLLLTLSDDVRVILIKLADRLHNMRTLDAMPPNKQIKIASETSFLYAPLANRLGLYAIKSELQDLILKYTEPEVYKTISRKLKESKEDRSRFINQFVYPLKKAFGKQGIKYEIINREKSVNSIWRKMNEKEIPIEEVYDLMAIRVLIDSPLSDEKADCWKVYSIITGFYRPNHDRLRDWISIPKANGYEALHTTVMSKTGKWVEIQIRSIRMNEIAEKGYAAHWKYKNEDDTETGLDEWLNKIRELLQNNESDALDFLDSFKLDLFSDEIFVFTPKGEIKTLPVGATTLDFAYSIHSQIGNTCIAGKVNHKLAPLNQKLVSGDQVEIITSKKQIPKDDWFNYVVTARANSHIKQAIKEERRKYKEKGKTLLKKYFSQLKIDFDKQIIKEYQDFAKLPSFIDLYYNVALGEIGIKELRKFYLDDERIGWLSYFKLPFIKSQSHEIKTFSDSLVSKSEGTLSQDLLDINLDKIDYLVAKCCKPIPGDDAIGFVLNKNTIQIHRTNCKIAITQMSKFGNRIVKAKWSNKGSLSFIAGIKILSLDKIGLIKDIVNIISSELNLKIKSFHLESKGDIAEATVVLYVVNINNLNDLINRLKKIKGIKNVLRIQNTAILESD